jgi:hypothetical protein
VKTAKELAEFFSSLPADTILAVPTIWDKALAHEEFRIATGENANLTDEQWERVADSFLNAEVFDPQAMFISIANELDLDPDELGLDY